MPRFHVRHAGTRTTVSLDPVAASYLALHLGCEPGSRRSHSATVAWLQSQIDERAPEAASLSRWLAHQILRTVVTPELRAAFDARTALPATIAQVVEPLTPVAPVVPGEFQPASEPALRISPDILAAMRTKLRQMAGKPTATAET